MTGYIVKEEKLFEALEKELRPMRRLQSIDDTFQTMDGTVVEPKPVPGGLLLVTVGYSRGRQGLLITPDSTNHVERAAQMTGANAYELGKLPIPMIPVQLYKLGEK